MREQGRDHRRTDDARDQSAEALGGGDTPRADLSGVALRGVDLDGRVDRDAEERHETAHEQYRHRATNEAEREKLIKKFAAASKTGDEKTLLALFSDEIVSISDGGGKVTAARKIIRDKFKLSHALSMFGTKFGEFFEQILYPINGEIGLLTFVEGKIYAATTFEVADGKISAMYRVMNPDKLKAFAGLKDSSETV